MRRAVGFVVVGLAAVSAGCMGTADTSHPSHRPASSHQVPAATRPRVVRFAPGFYTRLLGVGLRPGDAIECVGNAGRLRGRLVLPEDAGGRPLPSGTVGATGNIDFTGDLEVDVSGGRVLVACGTQPGGAHAGYHTLHCHSGRALVCVADFVWRGPGA